jgi:hypothetical protein
MRRVLMVVAGVVVLALGLLGASAASDQPHRYFRDAVVVDASREEIWSLLTDFAGYEAWNPYITRGTGVARVGAESELTFQPEGGDAETTTVEVLIVRPRRKLEWRSRMAVPGLLDHEQIFRVIPVTPGRWRIAHEARFEGLLAPFADIDDERAGLERMLEALAERAGRPVPRSAS